jgi:hypothetical protein
VSHLATSDEGTLQANPRPRQTRLGLDLLKGWTPLPLPPARRLGTRGDGGQDYGGGGGEGTASGSARAA